MDWILSHLGLVATLVIFFMGWLSQRRQTATKSEEASLRRRQPNQPVRPVASDSPAEDQIRRIQEEIRRKIQERAGTATPPRTTAAEPPVLPKTSALPKSRPTPQRTVPVQPVRRSATVSREQPEAPSAWATEQDREEQRRVGERRREERKSDPTATGRPPANTASIPASDEVNSWAAQLRDLNSVRRALVLREVLGPPVSMRR